MSELANRSNVSVRDDFIGDCLVYTVRIYQADLQRAKITPEDWHRMRSLERQGSAGTMLGLAWLMHRVYGEQ